ncbi:hypothetical protein HO173_010281 [Letharia columbiana]|uniref:Glutamine amidotransferase type-2 domain-containing protein n=1 Tax=Letharia columbiana TaxID=112416 RepID=A0A8H6FN13_9LECA|nr:uncharacterized protein HO173_010281 [Letharia columbiana]KAF6231529.1 hypothetical protein HO173_010281 [Letharia columbiana]
MSRSQEKMCRFLVYKGKDEILLSKLILEPQHSILTQSYDSRLRMDHRRPHNGDGFGIGYYTPPTLGPDPCIFTSTTPAWNCINLSRLASKTTSSLIFAHVRATTEGSLSDSNCHPFSHGSLMFMHNGNIACWRHVKREIALSVGQKWFVGVQGNTDSEWAFALFLDCLEKAGFDPDSEEYTANGFGHTVLRKAMLRTIKLINRFVDATPSELRDEMMDKRSLLNFAVSDGHSVVCTRYVSSTTDEAASLYFSSGTSWKQGEGPGQYKMERRDKGADIVLVASEPLTFERDNWVTVPTNSTITIHKQTVMIHPIIDEYYNHSPSYTRSSGFAVSKGLVSNAPGATQAITPGNLGNAVAT